MEDSNSPASSVDGKMSALIPNLNIPVNDSTTRISLRWKMTSEVVSLALSQNKLTQMTTAIHPLIFSMMTTAFYIVVKMKEWRISTQFQK
jgi:hypothetical protein